MLQIACQDLIAFFDGDEVEDIYSLEAAGGDILYLGCEVVIYSLLLLIGEWFDSNRGIAIFFTKKITGKPNEYEPDEDVEAEKNLALNTDPRDVKVNVRELRKVYGNLISEKVVAVEEVSFNIPNQQCFCILGANGAGKTTLFKILTGEIIASSGEAYLENHSITYNLDMARKFIGYCPQFDALSEKLSVKEHIVLYCEIKGIYSQNIPKLTDKLIAELDLEEYQDYLVETLSGGNKRKLSVAIALIGNPSIIFLDEPSSGLDPETRKKL